MRAESSRLPAWQLADVVDLERLIALDHQRSEAELAPRDLAIFTNAVEPGSSRSASPREKLRRWLEARRAQEPAGSLPGAVVYDALQTVRTVLAFGGLILGGFLAVLHLVYYGTKPINVVVFLAVTLLPQWLVLIALFAGSLFRGSRARFGNFGITRALLQRVARHLGGEKRLAGQALWGTMLTKQALYGRVWPWTLLRLTQVFALGFNAGVIAMLLLLITISNRAFGWETTLQIGPDAMFAAVRTFAWPWSWLPEAHPTLAQIVGSRVALQGVGAYSAEALVAWWPFLCYALLFYGLLPRVLLWVTAVFGQRRALRALTFAQAEARQILRRMEPLVVAGPAGAELEMGSAGANAAPSRGQCVLVVSRELEPAGIVPVLVRRGWLATATLRAEVDAGELGAELPRDLGADPVAVVVAIAATRPPIKAILLFLSALRAELSHDAEIAVMLVAPTVSDEELVIWRQKLATLHDPFLSVEPGALA